jgi:hypothetical protein
MAGARWIKVGIIEISGTNALHRFHNELPRTASEVPFTGDASHAAWSVFARRWAEVLALWGAALDPQGFDAGKKITGRKRHILVGTLGLPLGASVLPANIQDRDGARDLLQQARGRFPFIERIFAAKFFVRAPPLTAPSSASPQSSRLR